MKLKNLLLLIFALFFSILNAHSLLLNNGFENGNLNIGGNGNFSAGMFLPTATISGTATVCQNGTAEITFTGSNGTAPYTFTYNINNGPDITVVTTTGDSVIVTADTSVAGVFEYNLTNVAFGTNPADSQAQTGTATVTVEPLPEATIAGSSTVCLNAAAPNITFTGSGGTIPYTFVYNINNGSEITITTNNTNSINVPVPTDVTGTFVYNLVKVSSAGTCEQVLTESATVKVFDIPEATVSGTATVCLNDDKPNITFTGVNGEPPYTFSYNINGGAAQTITTYLPDVNIPIDTDVSGTFTYNLLGVSYAGVSGCSQAQTGSATITVNKLPTATITPSVTSVCVNGAAPDVTFTGTDGTGPYTFTYNINNGPDQTVTTTSGNSVTVSVPTTTAGIFNYNLISVSSGPVTACSQPQTGTATIYVGVYAEISAPFSSICPGFSVDVTIKGTPNATINFSSSPTPENYSVVLDANGEAIFTPFVITTTLFTLTSGTLVSPACTNTLSDTAQVLVTSTIACTGQTKAGIEIETPIPVCAPGDCTDLTASYYQLRPTTDYQVISIPYQNLFNFTSSLTMDANEDDVWADNAFILPFSFCFYGNNYSQVLVGSNGVITFDIAGVVPGGTQTPDQHCEWQFDASVPSASFPIKNAIYGVYQDTNIQAPPVTNPAVQNVNYYIGGTAPNRYFVANFNELPQFQCNSGVGLQTSQIILHETTNIIDVYVKKRTPCTSWNPTTPPAPPGGGGNGVIGIQNHAGTKGTVPPGRNTDNWSADHEAWRFLPAGAGDFVSIEWKDAGGNVVSSQNSINVCPTAATTYTVEASYTQCDNTIFTPKPSDTITIDIEPPLPVLDPQDIFMCTNAEPFHFNINQDAYILNGSTASDYDILYYEDEQSAKDYGGNDIFTTYGTIDDYVVASAASLPKKLWVRISNLISGTGCANIRSFVINAGEPAGSISYPDFTYLVGGDPVAVIASTDLTPGGVFTAAPVDPAANPPQTITIDPATGEIDLTGTTAGEYIITYTVAATVYCPEYVTTTTVFTVIKDTACTVSATNDFAICQGTSFDLTATVDPDDDTPTFEWSGPENFTSTDQNPMNVPSPSVAGVYTYTVIKKSDGIECATDSVIVTVHELPSVAFVTPSSTICTNAATTINFTGSANAYVTFHVSDTNGANSDEVVQLDSTGNYAYPATLQYDTTYELVKVESDTNPICSIPFPPGIEITVTVGLPDATVSIVNNVICSGDSADFAINGNPGAIVDYTNGTTPGTITLDTAGTATVTLTGLTTDTTLTLTNVTSNSTPSCSKALNVSASVTVNPLPAVNTFTGSTVTPICSGTPATLLINGTPNATVTYTDSGNNTYPPVVLDASGNASFTTPVIAASETFTLINITSSGTVQCMNSATQSITINTIASPVITTQPAGALACNGASVTFTVVASGSNLHYQWYGNLGNTVGTDQNTYTIAAPVPADAGNYSVTVTNECGTVTSQPANLAVSQPTIITVQPTGATVCEGDQITINVTATGVNLQYQWFKDSSTGPSQLTGQTNPTLIITPATLADAGTYFCEISNVCETVLSNNAVIVVNEKIAIDNQPSAVTLCAGESFTLSVVASGTDPTYQWYHNVIIPGATNASYTVNPATLADDGDYYVIVSGACTPPVTSSIVHVMVNETPVVVTQPIDVTVCEGDTVTLSIAATGTNLVYQWQQNGFDKTGATSNTLTIPVSALTDAGTYVCLVSNSVSSCPPVSSDPAEVVINVAPAIVTQPVSRIVCLGDPVNFTVGATGNNLTYQWLYNNVPIAIDGTSNSYSILATQLSNSGNYKVVVSSPSCPSVTSTVAILIVNPLPEATIANGLEQVICEGNAADVIFSGTPNAVVTYTINGGEEQTIILSPSGSAILQTGVLEASATYTLISVATNDTPVCTKSLSGEPNTVATVSVFELPDPVLDQDGYVCVDQTDNSIFSTYPLDTHLDPAQFTFKWYFNDDLLSETGPAIAADSIGVYKVIVTSIESGVNQCSRTATAPIVASLAPIRILTAEVVTGYFEDNATIVVTVDPPGDYEYRLDDGPYQDSNTFTGVRTLINFDQTGHHTVYARDKKACREKDLGVDVIDYPKYFTPNGDGFHDTWNITTLKNQPDTKIFIFDRYGKLLKEISSTGTGWDGTFNGKPMMADDYWFLVKYSEQGIIKEFKAHFAIKR